MYIFKVRGKKLLAVLSVLTLLIASSVAIFLIPSSDIQSTMAESTEENSQISEKKYIKWVDFDVTTPAMNKALSLDIKSHEGTGIQYNWIELLAYLGTKYGGDFSKYKESDMDTLVKKLENGDTIQNLTQHMKNYSYFLEAYTAVLDEFVGNYQIQVPNEDGTVTWTEKYGLKAFSPIAKTFPYTDGDDFGNSRTYGYKRKHLGHDMMAATGTPVIAVESGYIEELGWNQYGGWRIGIRSFDQKRYYFYAHFRKDYPYPKHLAKGMVVKAGDVIGYVGRTGYSPTENVNNIEVSHLHIGLQLIFDDSQKDGTNQIWIDFYNITKFLQKNKCAVEKIEGSKEYKRVYDFDEPIIDNRPVIPPNESAE